MKRNNEKHGGLYVLFGCRKWSQHHDVTLQRCQYLKLIKSTSLYWQRLLVIISLPTKDGDGVRASDAVRRDYILTSRFVFSRYLTSEGRQSSKHAHSEHQLTAPNLAPHSRHGTQLPWQTRDQMLMGKLWQLRQRRVRTLTSSELTQLVCWDSAVTTGSRPRYLSSSSSSREVKPFTLGAG